MAYQDERFQFLFLFHFLSDKSLSRWSRAGGVAWCSRGTKCSVCPGLRRLLVCGTHNDKTGKPRQVGDSGYWMPSPSTLLVCRDHADSTGGVGHCSSIVIMSMCCQQERGRIMLFLVKIQPRSCTYHFCSWLYSQNIVTWSHLVGLREMLLAG